MPLKIRLRQQGRVNRLTYRLVVTDSRSPRDGKYLEKLGHYDPHLSKDKDSTIVEDRILYWIKQGAQLSDKARALITRKTPGVMKNWRALREEKTKKRLKKRKRQSDTL